MINNASNPSGEAKTTESSNSPTMDDTHADFKESLSTSLPLGVSPHLETVLEIDQNGHTSEIPSTLQSPLSLNTPTTSEAQQTVSSARTRNRTDSLRVFTDKFRSISNDLLRSIESAHEMLDLNRSHFSAATQSAAAQQYHQNDNYLTPNLNAHGQFSKWPKVKKEVLSNKFRSNTVVASSNVNNIKVDPASDCTIRSGDSENKDVVSNLPSPTSYGVVNEQSSDLKKINMDKNNQFANIANEDEKSVKDLSYNSPRSK